MTVGDYPDFDSSPIWQGNPLYSHLSGPIPAAGTVLYSGPVTSWPTLYLRGFGTSGGFRLRVDWYIDAGLTQNVGTDIFDAPQGQGFAALYEVQAPFIKISIGAVTVAPVGAGFLVIIPTRSLASGFRPLVTPQKISVGNITIPANSTVHFLFTFIVIGQYQVAFTAVAPAASVSFSLETLSYDGTVATQLVPLSVVNPGGSAINLAPAEPLRLTLTNTTANPATITAFLISQQQGW